MFQCVLICFRSTIQWVGKMYMHFSETDPEVFSSALSYPGFVCSINLYLLLWCEHLNNLNYTQDCNFNMAAKRAVKMADKLSYVCFRVNQHNIKHNLNTTRTVSIG